MPEQNVPRRNLFQRLIRKRDVTIDTPAAEETPANRLVRLRKEESAQREALLETRKRVSSIAHAPLRAVLEEFYERDVVDLQLSELCSNTLERQLVAEGVVTADPRLPSGEDDAQRYAAQLPAMARISPTAAQMLLDRAGPTHEELAAATTEVDKRMWIGQNDPRTRGFPPGMDPQSLGVPPMPQSRFPELRDAGPAASTSRRFPELAPSVPESKSTGIAGLER